jgi:hypothetical protein
MGESILRRLPRALAVAIVGTSLIAVGRPAGADGAANARCANRLSIAFVGKSASAAQLAATDPKQAIDGLLQSPDFQERFARFINSQFNDAPGPSAVTDAPYLADAAYHMAKFILAGGGPWSDMFLGKYRLVSVASNPAVQADANGLGYFRSDAWFTRYQGNEPAGIKIATAYRIMNNVVGLRVTASTATPNSDVSATGRKAPGCAKCHYDNWYALDKVASVLPLKGQAYNAYNGGPQEMLGGKMIQNDQELVTALVQSENFSVNACRLAFKFLYGRTDNQCEGALLDLCVDNFKAQKTMQSALATIARDANFCE